MSDTIDSINRFEPTTGVINTLSPLNVDIEENKLLTYLNSLETEAKLHWDKPIADGGLNLTARRKQNLKYLFGRQLLGKNLKRYESEFLDNVIYEFEAILKSLAVSKMPDITVKAGGVSIDEARKKTAELLTKFFDIDINSDTNKNILSMMFKHMPVYLIAAKKYRWDANKKEIGEYVEEVINPEHILFDHTALSSNPDEMMFIIHYVEKTAKEWVMLFPKKEEEIKKYVESAHPSLMGQDKEEVLLAQKIRVAETWYDWFDKAEDYDPGKNPKFKFMSGVCWKLGKKTILDNIKNPNWDYEGHDVTTINGQPVSPEMMEQVVLTGQQPQGYEVKRIFNNYFKYPKKPFIFMTFDQFLRSAIDETSRIEQAIPLQKSMDNVERQTDYFVTNHKGKHMWSKDSGMTKKDIKKIDMDDPNSDICDVNGDLNNVHKFIQPEMPPAEMFIHIRERRDRMFSKVGTHGATRGEVTSDVATTNQISREADFTKNDDLVNSTILYVSTESIKARLHMIKLRYTEEHFKQLAGIEEGKYLYLRINNDSIDDGMEVVVKASTTDKLRAERNAQSMAATKFIEPFYYYKDMGIPDPEGRAEALYLFNTNPDMWYQQIVKGKSIQQIADTVIQGSVVPQEQPTQGMQPPMSPQALPANPTPANTSQAPTQPPAAPQGSPRGGIGGVLQKMGLIK